MVHLKPLSGRSEQFAPKATILETIHTGRLYHVGCQDYSVLNSIHGVIGGYRISAQRAEIFPVTSMPPGATTASTTDQMNLCYFWDPSADMSTIEGNLRHEVKDQLLPLKDCHLKANRLMLTQATLSGPELNVRDDVTMLSLSPHFDFMFSTDNYAAQLGVINLVQSSRFIRLENNDEKILLDTGIENMPVLHLENAENDQPVKYVSVHQNLGINQEHTFTFDVSQSIPDKVGAESVASVTVLEQYQSYFMQRAVTQDNGHSIWTPVYAPITWGWSIRVGRRTDGEWGILRRKLILPTTGNDGLQLPTWTNNTLNCSTSLD